MNSLFEKDHIKIKVSVSDYEDAIKKVGQILVDTNSIKENYIQSMIDAIKELGPYIVMAPGFALAHARPSEDVLKDDVSIITLKEPVCFNSINDPVYVIMCLAAKDSNSHIDLMQKIATILMKGDTIENLKKVNSVEDVQKIFEI
ncbi:MAG: PTS sugar transporter subunit IIA [Lachnospiraceae bacterium]|nr:PTS sugar transporter subunit IIA [Lachnospiraceae bacterium]